MWPVTMHMRSMKHKRCLTALLLILYLAGILATPVSAASAGTQTDLAADREREISAEEQAEPPVSKLAGGVGLVLLLALGAVVTHKRKNQEELGYDNVWPDGERIEDPYRRLAGTDRKKRRLF